MKILDHKGKLFGLVNVLDLLILLVIILALLVGYRFFVGGGISGLKKDVYFKVELRPVSGQFAEKIKKGDEIKDSVKGYYLGVVNDVKYSKDVSTNWDSNDRRFVKVESPEDYCVIVEIKANGTIVDTEKENNIYAENVPVKVGKELSIKGKGYAGTGYIVEVREDQSAEAIGTTEGGVK